MENTEKFRGQTTAIILFVLSFGDCHTDELKEIIDQKFSEVKIGTLYSIISRIKTQGLIHEYRASSVDGSRRKYYKITDLGKETFASDYSHLFIDVEPLPIKESVKKEIVAPKVESKKEESEENVYLNYVKRAEQSDFYGDIDFSNVVLEDKTPVKTDKIVEETATVENQEDSDYSYDATETFVESGVDYDSLVSSEYEYSDVLSKLFPKNNVTFEPTIENEPTSPTVYNEPQVVQDFSNIYEFSEKENIKIRTSGDTNRYQGTKILVNKLNFHASIITFALSIIEFLVLSLIFSATVPFNTSKLITLVIIFGSFSLIMGLVYLLNYSNSVKDLPKFINMFEIALIITISTTIITFASGTIVGVDYHVASDVMLKIVLPIVESCNVPIYVTLVHLLSKLDYYQTV